MQEMKLKNGKKLLIKEGNTLTEIKTVVKTPAEVEDLKKLLTEENTDELTINGSSYEHLRATDIRIDVEEGEFIAVFGLVPMNEEELKWLKLKMENKMRDEAFAQIMGIVAGGAQ